jgi:hypothetical protein
LRLEEDALEVLVLAMHSLMATTVLLMLLSTVVSGRDSGLLGSHSSGIRHEVST